MHNKRMNKKLKAAIIMKYGSQADFAEAIDTDETIISRIIRGRRQLDSDKQSIWAKALECRLEDIFANE
jgi:transcriptional regulator with XRE-family HTH domain